ncbi:MAG: hypothetical protein DRI57_20665 [Deltaproteobacteria bacterium]|nr:MAG: hypothetical protein DRI57_20665 [Deltaproteobacteria bacterium]
MQQLILNIDEQDIGEGLSRIAQEEGKNIQDVILNEIRSLVRKRSPSPFRKCDPLRHSVQIHYPADEDLSCVRPFTSVKDSAKFGRKLRRKLWKRTTDG